MQNTGRITFCIYTNVLTTVLEWVPFGTDWKYKVTSSFKNPKLPRCGLWDSLGRFLSQNGPSDMSLITQGTVCWGMLQGLGSDVIKPSCSVCFCKVKTNTSMSIWTQLWYFYLPHQLQAAIIISNLMKLVQHLASSCLFDSEQMEGHLVWAEQTGSSWGGVCIPTFLQRFKAAFLHPPPTSSVPVMTLDQTQGILWIQQS